LLDLFAGVHAFADDALGVVIDLHDGLGDLVVAMVAAIPRARDATGPFRPSLSFEMLGHHAFGDDVEVEQAAGAQDARQFAQGLAHVAFGQQEVEAIEEAGNEIDVPERHRAEIGGHDGQFARAFPTGAQHRGGQVAADAGPSGFAQALDEGGGAAGGVEVHERRR